jgi:hypothetical protein
MAKNRFREIQLLVASTMLLSAVAHAGFSITGTVTWLEVWRTGNVDFQLSTATTNCNGYFILNASDPGFKNEYAALLAAKRTGTPVSVFSTACVAADNYTGSLYNSVDYLYPQD